MSAMEALLGVGLGVVLVVGLKLLLLYQWHRAGRRWPDEDLEDYVKHSPRFEDGVDTWTGNSVETFLRARGEDPNEYAGEVRLRP